MSKRKTLGQMSEVDRERAVARALAAWQRELTASAPAIGRLLSDLDSATVGMLSSTAQNLKSQPTDGRP